MTIAFYKVGNSKNYGRHEFDNIYDNRNEILKKLNELRDEEFRLYDLTNKYDKWDFIEDYNDEILDGGWWCVEIPD